MDETEQEVIEQTTVALPFLDEEVPVLYLADGRTYIPVRAVCQTLGIHPDSHIQCWWKLVLWATARKLPFQTARRGKRLVWRLPISQVPFLYSLFNWELVSHARRSCSRRATEERAELADRSYKEMQQRYRATRQALFNFLTTLEDIDLIFQQFADTLLPLPDGGFHLTLSNLCDRGHFLFQEIADHARKMLQDQGSLPIVDAMRVNAVGSVIDTFSMPLLPLGSIGDNERLSALAEQLLAWMQELEAYWCGRG